MTPAFLGSVLLLLLLTEPAFGYVSVREHVPTNGSVQVPIDLAENNASHHHRQYHGRNSLEARLKGRSRKDAGLVETTTLRADPLPSLTQVSTDPERSLSQELSDAFWGFLFGVEKGSLSEGSEVL